MVASCSPRPTRVVQRARLWAMTWTASQAPFGRLRIGGETARGEVIEPDAVLQVADGVLDLGVAAMVGLEVQGISVPVGDEGVIAVVGKQRQLGAGRGLDPPDDEEHWCGVGLTLEGRVAGLRHIGGAVQPVWYGRPVLFGYGLDDIVQTFVLADGDGEADIHFAADGDQGVGPVWLPHAARIPICWHRICPVRLPLPIIPGVNASAHRFGGFGLRYIFWVIPRATGVT